MRLGKQQRNEVFEAITGEGSNPRQFTLEEKEWAEIKHAASGSEFSVRLVRPLDRLLRNHQGAFRVWSKVADDPIQRAGAETWEDILARMREWLADLQRAQSTPDLWEQLRDPSTDGADDLDNSPFTEEERQEIAEKFDELRDHVQTSYSLSEAQMVELNAKLDYLLQAAKRVGRKDWRILVGGTLLTMLTDAVLPRDTTQAIFIQLVESVSHMLGHPLPKLLPGALSPGPLSA